jgi:flagellar basal-body rod protein FlgG
MRALYTAATGMGAFQTKIDNIANNLANANTNGYKKVREGFEDLVYQRMGGVAGEEGASVTNPIDLGTGVRLAYLSRDMRNGDTIMSSSPTDLLIDGDGFFVVESPNGEQLYTRDGHFQTDAEGNLVTAHGYRVSPGIQIPQGGTLVVGSDGALSAEIVTTAGTESIALGTLAMARFSNATGLESIGGNTYRSTPASGEPIEATPGEDGAGSVLQYAVEGSNVDVAEELVNMITAQRSYELSSKVIQAADEMMQTAAGLRR